MKNFTSIIAIFLSVFILWGCFPKDNKGKSENVDSVREWTEEQAKKTGYKIQEVGASKEMDSEIAVYNENIAGVGEVTWLNPLECPQIIMQEETFQIDNVTCFSDDLNRDKKQDFIIRLEDSSKCKNSLCQTYVFLSKEDSYKKITGPKISMRKVAVHKNSNNLSDDLVYYKNHWGECVWNWKSQSDTCFLSKPHLQETDSKNDIKLREDTNE